MEHSNQILLSPMKEVGARGRVGAQRRRADREEGPHGLLVDAPGRAGPAAAAAVDEAHNGVSSRVPLEVGQGLHDLRPGRQSDGACVVLGDLLPRPPAVAGGS